MQDKTRRPIRQRLRLTIVVTVLVWTFLYNLMIKDQGVVTAFFKMYLVTFLRNGLFLAFIPVFFEAVFWLLHLGKEEQDKEDEIIEVTVQEHSDHPLA